MTYWERRKLAALRRMESTTLNQIPEIIEAFEQAKKGVEAEVQSFYGRYAEHNKVTLEQAQKALSQKELHNFRDRLKDYERLAKRAIGTFDLQVDNLSTRARITRLQALEMDIDAILQELYQRQRDGIEGAVGRLYTDQYYHAQFDISKASGCLFNFAKVDQAAISAVMVYPVMGADLSSRLWRQDVDIGFRIRQTLGRMFAEGRPAQDFADDLAEAIGAVQVDKDGNVTGAGKKFEAYRLLYTEAAYASERASQQAYQDDGIERYQYVATFDTDTCGICGALDGKTFEVKDAVPGVNSPPLHPFCRCTTIPAIDGLKSVAGERAARDPKTGKTITLPGDMTYKEWKSAVGLGEEKAKESAEYARLKTLDQARRARLRRDSSLSLPNAECVVLPPDKFLKYLFNEGNPVGYAKGVAFTRRLGYNIKNWKELSDEIRRRAPLYPAKQKGDIGHGMRYEQKMILYGKNGTPANVIVGWIDENGTTRMTSAYVKEANEHDD